MDKEEKFLEIIKKNLKYSDFLGDDGAYLKDLGLVITHDTLIQDVHFKSDYMTYEEIGQKAVTVNISDLLSMGAKPLYITVSLSGILEEDIVDKIYKGINKKCEEYDTKVIGGDLTKGRDLTISICAVGKSDNRNISSRKNAKEGYIVACAGEFGSSAYYLKTKDDNFKINHTNPRLFPDVSDEIAQKAIHPYAMMDSSDGLMACLLEISKQSDVGFDIKYDKIPKRINDKNLVLYGGEDFCPVICIDKEDFQKINGLIEIGRVIKDKKILIDNIDYTNKKWEGYSHFE